MYYFKNNLNLKIVKPTKSYTRVACVFELLFGIPCSYAICIYLVKTCYDLDIWRINQSYLGLFEAQHLQSPTNLIKLKTLMPEIYFSSLNQSTSQTTASNLM